MASHFLLRPPLHNPARLHLKQQNPSFISHPLPKLDHSHVHLDDARLYRVDTIDDEDGTEPVATPVQTVDSIYHAVLFEHLRGLLCEDIQSRPGATSIQSVSA